MTLTFSNSHLWSKCADACSPREMPFLTPREESEAQREGSAADWLAGRMLAGHHFEESGIQAPNGWTIDATMVRHVQAYVDIVRRHGEPMTQTDLSLWDGLVNGRPDNHTVDGTTLRVYELKYGYQLVEPDENPQLLLAAGALYRPHEHLLISLEIFQPRAYHPAGHHRRWVIRADELDEYMRILHRSALHTTIQNPIASPGVQCERCPKRGACATLSKNIGRMYETIRGIRRAGKPNAAELGAEGDFLELCESLLKAKRTGVLAEIEARIRAGEGVPGWHLKPGRADRELTATPEVIAMLTGRNAYQEPKPKSPKMLEDEGVPPEIMGVISKPGTGKLKLSQFTSADVAKLFK